MKILPDGIQKFPGQTCNLRTLSKDSNNRKKIIPASPEKQQQLRNNLKACITISEG